jgi:hypothetical protein
VAYILGAMSVASMDELFGHPEEHHSLAKSGSPDEQLFCANLFLEPVQVPRSTA